MYLIRKSRQFIAKVELVPLEGAVLQVLGVKVFLC